MLTGLCRTSLRRHCRAMLPFVCLMIFGLCARWLLTVRAQNTIPLAIISAASFATDLAPESIASIFGSKLATQTATGTDTDPNTPGVQLPTQLGGTTVEVNGQRAGLFFVSAGQINFVLPGSLSGDTATVTVRAGDGSLSMGTMRLLTAAPAIFTANSNGTGVPAGVLLRQAASGARTFEPLALLNTQKRWVPKPFSFNAAGERLFLVLFLTGARGALDTNGDRNVNENVHVLLGGEERVPDFIGKQGELVGVDQLNLEIPRSLSGRGALTLAVNYSSLVTSNVTNIEIGGTNPAPLPVSITTLNPTEALTGDTITINGANFAATANDNQVFLVDEEGKNFRATVTAATSAQLRVVVPFGAGSGTVRVLTPQSETQSIARLTLLTSVSGFVEAADRQPLPGVPVRVRDTNISATTNAEGGFILRNVPPSAAQEIELDPPGARLPFPKFVFKLRVRAGHDYHGKITLQQQTGPIIVFPNPDTAVGAASFTTAAEAVTVAPTARSIQTGGVIFEVADNTTAVFPGGAASGGIQLDLVANSRTPAKLPPGVFSSTIAQLAPFGVRLTPGGKLTFPNSDNVPVNAQPKLYKLDQTPGSSTLGEFIEAGAATISTDGKRIETAVNAITETSIYFVAVPRPLTSVIGRVVESNGAPVRNAQVSTRGQEVTTDGLGQFVLLNVPITNASDLLSIEASFQRPGGRVDRVTRPGLVPVPNGVTRVADLVLPSPATQPNRPPTLIVPPTLSATQNTPRDVSIIVSDPDAGQTLQVTVTGAPFATIVQNGSNYFLRLTPGAVTAGNYTLTLRATDSLGLSTTQSIALTVVVNRAPVLSVPVAQTAAIGQQLLFDIAAIDPDAGQTLTLSATGLPNGASFSQTTASTGRFMWTPNVSQVGGFTVSFVARDNGVPSAQDTKTVTVTVVAPLQWAKTAGPYGGTVYAMISQNGFLFAGTAGGGVFRSDDNGDSWKAVNEGLTGLRVYSFVANNQILFAGTDKGVFRSADNGNTWIYPTGTGLGSRKIQALAIKGQFLFAGTSSGSFRSTDAGETWGAGNTGLTNTRVQAFAVIGNDLFVGTDGGGVFRSTDNGATWGGLNNGLNHLSINCLTVSGTALLAGTSAGGIYRLSSLNTNWTQINNGLTTSFVDSITVSGAVLFAGGFGAKALCRSTDGGQNWAELYAGLPLNSYGYDPEVYSLLAAGNLVFAGLDGPGVYRLNAGSASWMAANKSLSENLKPRSK